MIVDIVVLMLSCVVLAVTRITIVIAKSLREFFTVTALLQRLVSCGREAAEALIYKACSIAKKVQLQDGAPNVKSGFGAAKRKGWRAEPEEGRGAVRLNPTQSSS